MRALVGLVAMVSSTIAHAESPPDRRTTHISLQPTVAYLSRTETYERYGGIQGPDDHPEYRSGTGFGGGIEVGTDWRLSPSFALGAVVRIWQIVFDVQFVGFHESRTDVARQRGLQFGPQFTLSDGRLYFRGETTVGGAGTKAPASAGVGVWGLGVGAEVGYQLRIGAASSAQFGLGASAAWMHGSSRGDDGLMVARGYLITMAATLSFVRSFD